MYQLTAEVSMGLMALFIKNVHLPKVNKKGNVHINVIIEVPSCNHCCSGKAITITKSECMSVALVI
jgi:hypothetical protein